MPFSWLEDLRSVEQLVQREEASWSSESKRMDLIRNSQSMKKEEESHELTSARAADLMVLNSLLNMSDQKLWESCLR